MTNCPVCGTPCEIVGHTTKHYEPIKPVVGVKWPEKLEYSKGFCCDFVDGANSMHSAFMSEIAKLPSGLKEISEDDLTNFLEGFVKTREYARKRAKDFLSHFGTRVLSEQEIYQAIVDSGHCKNDYDETMAIAKAILTSTRWKVER